RGSNLIRGKTVMLGPADGAVKLAHGLGTARRHPYRGWYITLPPTNGQGPAAGSPPAGKSKNAARKSIEEPCIIANFVLRISDFSPEGSRGPTVGAVAAGVRRRPEGEDAAADGRRVLRLPRHHRHRRPGEPARPPLGPVRRGAEPLPVQQ